MRIYGHIGERYRFGSCNNIYIIDKSSIFCSIDGSFLFNMTSILFCINKWCSLWKQWDYVENIIAPSAVYLDFVWNELVKHDAEVFLLLFIFFIFFF